MDTEQLSMTKKTLVGVQFLFVAFGATVSGASSDRHRSGNGSLHRWCRNLSFHFITKGGAYFPGSSFALSPLSSLLPSNGDCRNNRRTNQRFSGVFHHERPSEMAGQETADRIFPPVVIGPAIILIGLSLSGSAVDMAKTN